MYHIRTTKTSSSATAVQVVKYENRKLIIAAHIGSAHDKEELIVLKKAASSWIEKASKQQSLFLATEQKRSKFALLENCQYLGIRHYFVYEIITQIFARFSFHTLESLLTDLVLMRIIEPASKLYSVELLDELFGIKYSRRDFYRHLPTFGENKDKVTGKTLSFAKKEFNFDFSLVFYDVTSLYFESFQSDDLRKPGFSKDGKSQQPQILIGLVVNSDGFPLAYEIFEGNKFEGHTLIPVISKFKNKHKIDKLTVVADAAMISFKNIEALKANDLSYIVGARMASLPRKLVSDISSQLNCQDGTSIRVKTECGNLVCDFSEKRYRKDKNEMEKQLKKAENLLLNPAIAKRTKFVKNKDKTSFELNTELVERSRSLLGIKGYYTNLPEDISNSTVIKQYHNLWHVELSFRIAKSDLQIRPIYHFKKQSIETHVLICFMALAVCKYMELKTGKSTKQIVRILKSVTDARILNTLTEEEIIMRSEITESVREVLSKLNLPY